MTILAIDPGTTQSGWVLYDPRDRSVAGGVVDNDEMLRHITHKAPIAGVLAIEMVASYGMAVGREVFETCVWIGRFQQRWRDPEQVLKVYRKDVKLHLCGSPKAKDANIRQALLDLWPATGGGSVRQVGTKGKPGPLFGMGTHTWPALGVALVAAERIKSDRAIVRRKLSM